MGWDSTIGKWARVEGTPSDPNPNDPYAKIDSETLFREGKLTPSITILGKHQLTLRETCISQMNCKIFISTKAVYFSSALSSEVLREVKAHQMNKHYCNFMHYAICYLHLSLMLIVLKFFALHSPETLAFSEILCVKLTTCFLGAFFVFCSLRKPEVRNTSHLLNARSEIYN